MAERTTMRQQEKKENEATIQDAQDAETAVAQAQVQVPLTPPKLAGWLARPPCMWAPHHVWVPHHVFGFPTMYFDQWYQVSGI